MPTSLRRQTVVVTLSLWLASLFLFIPATVFAETDVIDLKALAKKARPAVMLVVVKDARGEEIATGTGFLVSSDGKLFTNFHVIKNAASAVAKAEGGGSFPVEGVLASDPKNDLVLLQIKGKDLPFLTLAAGDKIEAGTRVAVIGSPLGLEGTISEGIVSAVRELMGERRMLQITAAISPGSSGSPVLNGIGEVLGVATLLLRGGQALNFAVPCDVARSLQAKAKESSTPQPLSAVIVREEDKIYSDPDCRAAGAAKAAEDYVGMLKHSQTLVQRYPESSFAHGCLGVAYLKLKFTGEAIAAFKLAIKLKPDDAIAWRNLAFAYDIANRAADALGAFQQVTKLKPDSAEAWRELGGAYYVAGPNDAAIAAYQRAIKLEAFCADSWLGLAGAFEQADRRKDAIETYEYTLKLKPDHAPAWYCLGSAYARAGRGSDAIRAYQKAVDLKLNHDELWYALGLAYFNANRMSDAIRALQQATRMNPDMAKAWHCLGIAYVRSHQTAKAWDAVGKLEVLDPVLTFDLRRLLQ